MAKTRGLGTRVKSLLLENAWVQRTSDRFVRAVLAFADSAEEVGPRKAAVSSAKKTVRKAAGRKPVVTRKAGAPQKGAVRAEATVSARSRKIPRDIRSTGGHHLSGEVVERAVKRPTSGFKVKKGKRT